MPAPKKPNTEPARLALATKRETERREREIISAAIMLRDNGHIVLRPDEVEWIRANSDVAIAAFMRGLAS